MGWWGGLPWPTGASWTSNRNAETTGTSRASSLQEHVRPLLCSMEKQKRSEEEKEPFTIKEQAREEDK